MGACSTMREKSEQSCNVQTAYALIWLGPCLGPLVKTRSIFGSGAIIVQSQHHMNFNPVNLWHRLGSCCLRVGHFFVRANTIAGDRADSRTVSRRRGTICNGPERVT